MKEITSKTSELRRPGPYGPASELVPKNQKVETVEYSDNLFDVLLRICQGGYSQTPVKKDGKWLVNMTKDETMGAGEEPTPPADEPLEESAPMADSVSVDTAQ